MRRKWFSALNDFQYGWEWITRDNQYWWQGILKKMHTQRCCLRTVQNMGHFRNWCLNKIFTCLHYFMRTCFKESSAKALSAFLPTGFLFSQVGDCTRLYSEEETLQFPLLFISSLTALQLLQYSVQTWSCTSLDQMSNLRKYENITWPKWSVFESIHSSSSAHIFDKYQYFWHTSALPQWPISSTSPRLSTSYICSPYDIQNTEFTLSSQICDCQSQ